MASTEDKRNYASRVALFYAALFLIMGVHLPFLPVWLDFKNLSAGEIAVITATPLFLRALFTPFIAMRADRTNGHRRFLIALAAAALALGVLLSTASGFWTIFALVFAYTIALSTMMPLIETIAVSGVKAAGLDYGRMRLWGSLSFIAIGFAAGAAIDLEGPGIVVWMIIAASLATLAAALLLPRPKSKPSTSALPARGAPALFGGELKHLATSPVFLIFLLAVGAVMGAHGMFYTFGALHWRAQGLSTSWIGALWAIGVLAEVVLFAYSARAIAAFGVIGLILAGAVAGILRWTWMAFDPGLAALIFLQLLHALTYGAAHLGAIHFISEAVPEEAAGTAQALYGTFAAGIMTAAATLASGPLYRTLAGEGYLVMAALTAVGLGAALLLHRQWSRGSILADERPPATGEAPSVEDGRDEIGPKFPIGPNV